MLRKWWKEGIVYQVYPRSFYDSNNDGIGDLQGIIKKIDYIKDLGVDIVWLNPVYESPNDDNGYDISDYESIMEEFGTMDDWEELLEELHKRDIKLIMDLVVNHTSDEHKWFVESRSSKDNKYRDYYLWRPDKGSNPPNNWFSVFGGSAWEYDKETEEYYLHLFTKKQPDLNWDNPDLRKDIYKMMNFWLDKGIDGFRLDVINMISKQDKLPDIAKPSKDGFRADTRYITNGPRVHEFIQEMYRETVSKYDVMTVGEIPGTNVEQAINYVDKNRNELNMVIHFDHVGLDFAPGGNKFTIGEFKLRELKYIFNLWQTKLHGIGWNCNYLMNHDQPRSLSRFASDLPEFRKPAAKMLATFLMSLEGTPFVYMGEEIGMTNVAYESIEDYNDIESLSFYYTHLEKGIDKEALLSILHLRSRDNSRTPMQWDDSKNAGFSNAVPWLKVNPNYKEINVERDRQDSDSIFNFYKKMIQIRKDSLLLIYGDFKLIDEPNERVFAYLRSYEDQQALVILNFSKDETSFKNPESFNFKDSKLVVNNLESLEINAEEGIIFLKPYQALIFTK